jgi:chromate reductase, NAD(P)H dehydrogenase (quinone)
MTAPEAYIQVTPGLITGDGEATEASTGQFLRAHMEAFGAFVTRVLTVLPRVDRLEQGNL